MARLSNVIDISLKLEGVHRHASTHSAGVVIGGKVPVVITSRSDEAQARLASIAAAVVALD